MDTLTDLHEACMAAVLDTLHATRTLDRLERRDWLVFRRIASLVEGLPIADVAEGSPSSTATGSMPRSGGVASGSGT